MQWVRRRINSLVTQVPSSWSPSIQYMMVICEHTLDREGIPLTDKGNFEKDITRMNPLFFCLDRFCSLVSKVVSLRVPNLARSGGGGTNPCSEPTATHVVANHS